MNFGQIVYHVAHPHVKAVVAGPFEKDRTGYGPVGLVCFSKPVSFNGCAPGRMWICNERLLHDSAAEAVENQDPDWQKKEPKEWGRDPGPVKGLYDYLNESDDA